MDNLIKIATDEAMLDHRDYVSTEYLVLALIKSGFEFPHPVTYKQAKQEINKMTRNINEVVVVNPPLTPRAKLVLKKAENVEGLYRVLAQEKMGNAYDLIKILECLGDENGF